MQWRLLLAKLANEGFLSPPYCAETSHTTWADQNKKWFQTTRCFLFFYYYREGHLGVSNYFWLIQQYCRARKPRLEESCLPCISGGQYHKEPGFFLQLQTFSLKGKEKKKRLELECMECCFSWISSGAYYIPWDFSLDFRSSIMMMKQI